MRHAPLLLLLILAAAGCAGGADGIAPTEERAMYPPPPETPRIQYLTSFSTAEQFRGGEGGGVMDALLGEKQNLEILRPYGIALRDGKIYICDSRVDGLIVADMNDRSLRYHQPQGRGTMKTPLNVCLDSAGAVYVADGERRQVVVFSPALEYVGEIGGAPADKPVDVQCVGNELWVLDLGQHRIAIYSRPDLTLLRTFPENAAPDSAGYLFSPVNFVIGDDRVYVSDMGDARVKVYDRQGVYLSSIGGLGAQIGQFTRPKGVALDKLGNLYVADAAFENVQLFDKTGRFLMHFGGPYQRKGDMYLPAKVLIDYVHTPYFTRFVAPGFALDYLIFVTNQYGPDKVSVYGFLRRIAQ